MTRTSFRTRLIHVARKAAKLAACLAILAAVLFLWSLWLDRPPNYTVVFPPPPTPNALDYFARAANARQHPRELDMVHTDWRKHEVWAMDAAELQRKKREWSGVKGLSIYDDLRTDLTVSDLLRDNAPALLLVREGLKHSYAFIPAADPTQYYNGRQKAHAPEVWCRKLIEVNALYLLGRNDGPGAADALVDLMRFNTMTDPIWYQRSTGYRELRALGDKLPARDVRTLVQRMDTFRRLRPTYGQALARVKPEWLNEILWFCDVDGEGHELLISPVRWTGLPNIHPNPMEDRLRMENWIWAWSVPLRVVPGRAERYLTACVEVAKLPVSARARYPNPPRDCLNWSQFGWDERERDGVKWALWEFQQDALMLNLALHGYRAEHGTFPRALQDLIADHWLTELPLDPFTRQDTVRYRPQSNRFTLYSVGPDGKDDAGSAITNVGPPPPDVYDQYWPHLVRVGSVGDVVFGVNERAEENSNSGRL
jgi:hypothetical protein